MQKESLAVKFRWFTALFVIFLTTLNLRAAETRRPNILWLVAEDFGPHLSCIGTKEVWTPNIDLRDRPTAMPFSMRCRTR